MEMMTMNSGVEKSKLILPERVDFSQLLWQLKKQGINFKDVAKIVGVRPSTLHRIFTRDTRCPSYELGVRLIALAQKEMNYLDSK